MYFKHFVVTSQDIFASFALSCLFDTFQPFPSAKIEEKTLETEFSKGAPISKILRIFVFRERGYKTRPRHLDVFWPTSEQTEFLQNMTSVLQGCPQRSGGQVITLLTIVISRLLGFLQINVPSCQINLVSHHLDKFKKNVQLLNVQSWQKNHTYRPWARPHSP